MPAEMRRRSLELWVGCVAGALEETEYAAKLRAAGFGRSTSSPWRVYNVDNRGPHRQRFHPCAETSGTVLLRPGVLRMTVDV